jgi:large subunit ribosomal protein L18
MSKNNPKFVKRAQRVHNSVRLRSNNKPRLSVFRSASHIYAQIIDDSKGVTIASASTLDKDLKSKVVKTSDLSAATSVGELIAKRALEHKVEAVVFDRGGYKYHGRVKALADAARDAGLKF